MTKCRSKACGAEVVFVRSSTSGRQMILDAKPAKGVVLIDTGPAMEVHTEMLAGKLPSPDDPMAAAVVVDVFTDHHATCRAVDDWRAS